MRSLIALLFLVVIVVFPSSALAVAPPSTTEKAMLAKINTAREARGLRKLRFEGRLQRVARWMNKDMINHNRFSHTDSLGRDPFERLDHFGYYNRSWRGENLAAGNFAVADTYAQWWNSAPHRRNMLSSHYRYVGISRICKESSMYNCYWTTEFGGHWTLGFDS